VARQVHVNRERALDDVTGLTYNTTPIGRRKQAAAVGTPQRELATALPPVNSIAVTRMLVMRPKIKKTMCVTTPYLALMTSRKVCALGARRLSLSARSVTARWSLTVRPERFNILDGQGSKKQDLDCSSRCVPERSGDTVGISYTRRLKQRSSPSPARDDSSSNETGFDGPAGG
jgi:hypothetical protein